MGGRRAISAGQARGLVKDRTSLNRQKSRLESTLTKQTTEFSLTLRKTLYPNISDAERNERLDKLEKQISETEKKISAITKQQDSISKKLERYQKQSGGSSRPLF